MKKFLVILTLILNIIIFSEKAVFLQEAKPPLYIESIKNLGNFYLNINDIIKGFDIKIFENKVRNVIILSYKDKILEVVSEENYSKIDFINKYKNSVIVYNKKIFVKEDVIKDFFNLSIHKEKDIIFLYDSTPKIKEFNFSSEKISLLLDKFISRESIKYSKVDDIVILTVSPVQNLKIIPSGIDYSYDSEKAYIKFKSSFDYDLEINKNKILLTMKNTNQSKNSLNTIKANTNYEEKVYKIKDSEYKVYSAKIDFNKFDLKIDTNRLGTYSDINTFFEEKKPYFSINASFFNPKNMEPVANLIKDNKLIYLSAQSYRPNFYITKDGSPNINYLKLEYQIYINNIPLWIKAINTNWKSEVKVYTSEYFGNISETQNDYLFYLVQDKKIISTEPIKPIDNQKLIVINKKYEKYFKDIKVGDSIEESIKNSLDVEIKELAGTGPFLINNEFSQEKMIEEKRAWDNDIIYGKRSRTILAIDNNNVVTFIVAEGNNSETLGLNYDDCKALLEKIGNFKKAVLLDGGSSTIFYYNGIIKNKRNENWRKYIPVFISSYKKSE
ncbi:hypothetical protein OSSY52_12580 [Tepiditoga spiralis]|uniref:Phosphodiester glycosidase domain-containing protein n=1 Tax=Tepiditoga spiralis TaxID=2108365 RepID=A0A7G1G844_9BACT|nr:phosphodiester glycosidase family protein [Tepiditoga spiralis]BBE31117.1 hypothetical protein OSSY52_12580 [Tepiditoga spiralis]